MSLLETRSGKLVGNFEKSGKGLPHSPTDIFRPFCTKKDEIQDMNKCDDFGTRCCTFALFGFEKVIKKYANCTKIQKKF